MELGCGLTHWAAPALEPAPAQLPEAAACSLSWETTGLPSLQTATPHLGIHSIHECEGGLGPLLHPRKWLCLECRQEGGLQRPGREQWAWWLPECRD